MPNLLFDSMASTIFLEFQPSMAKLMVETRREGSFSATPYMMASLRLSRYLRSLPCNSVSCADTVFQLSDLGPPR